MTPAPRRRLSVEQRKESIISAAGSLFSASTYSEVSTQEIATASGTSQALIFHYFGSKADLYATWVSEVLHTLLDSLRSSIAEVPPNTSRRDQIRIGLETYLDHIERNPLTWSIAHRGGDEPAEATNRRLEIRDELYDELLALLNPGSMRGRYAIAGFIGFLNAACLEWSDAGCPDNDRGPLLEATLGSLEGALGDWGG
ncbi:TetR/AcrR family transcriptional regulator [Corynebacterium lubricantis]|uniref:TetR/AcrR family transcriptional regulator n=1 Tax=Corynebacterium lubricantis TaxID=541095 RepID=UPI00037E5536|nr:TetR/AcrR family transcriptional regulator [Corynebacterium lubricantis]